MGPASALQLFEIAALELDIRSLGPADLDLDTDPDADPIASIPTASRPDQPA